MSYITIVLTPGPAPCLARSRYSRFTALGVMQGWHAHVRMEEGGAMYTRHPDHLTLSDEGRRLLAQALKESGGDILLSRDLLRHRESDMDGVKRVLGAVAEGRAHRTALADVGAIPDGKVWKLSGAAQ